MKNKWSNLGLALSREAQKKLVGGEISLDGVSCECENGKSAGMASCDTCERYCKDEWNSKKKVCD